MAANHPTTSPDQITRASFCTNQCCSLHGAIPEDVGAVQDVREEVAAVNVTADYGIALDHAFAADVDTTSVIVFAVTS